MSNPTLQMDNPVSVRRNQLIDAMKTGDVARIVEFFEDDVVYMPPNDTSLYGREEVRAWHEEYCQYFRIAAMSVTEQEVTISGDWAVESSTYMVAITPASGENRMRDDGRVLAFWKHDGSGTWRIWQQLWNSAKPVGIGTNRYMARLMQKKPGIKR